ncbi:Phage Tail Protein X [Pelagimonas phthalicica]|uniref:Phage Tail Protein X n=1 Tax=Pelagimonas phthalicica TaxID=1037362 RepID=A0A238JAR9_9RHOB|nr:tail protein X [Pelagimonas phthalicica]TDS94171.1 phage tail protein X [Pelagimonas phthalicica]SMX27304.1 Phage Tail Protein X [Pelagimonas phthalicica]
MASDLYYVTSDGDVLDQVVSAHYGDALGGKVEAVLRANSGLAAEGAVLRAGLRIALPERGNQTPVETAQLWG